MPVTPLDEYDLKILNLADRNRDGILYRGLFGWPMGSVVNKLQIKHLVSYGYVEFIYDWDSDKPAVRITTLGRSRLTEERERSYYRPAKTG